MVQVSRRSLVDDSIKECHIHDLLRDVAIEKAKEDNFVTVWSTFEGAQRCWWARRVAVHNLDCSKFMKYASSNLRTLLCYNTDLPNCSRHRLLKVLRTFDGGRVDMKCIEKLSHLRYLQLTHEAINWDKRSLDKLIGSMKFLQTLDLRFIWNWDGIYVPDCMWHIKTLRHVLLPYISGQPLNTDLPNLQTLSRVIIHESWDYTNLPNLPNLRELEIFITEGLPRGGVAAFLHTLKKLLVLRILGWDIPTKVIDMKGFPFYQHLISLRYEGTLSLSCNGLDVTMFPTNLMSLTLVRSGLQRDPMPVVERLQGLKSLHLWNAYSYQTMKCSAGGFPRLQELKIWFLEELEEWEIEEGAMPMLKNLVIDSCPKLQEPQGLQHLTTLKGLTWRLYGEESGPSKTEEIRNICKHVPSITICGVQEDSD